MWRYAIPVLLGMVLSCASAPLDDDSVPRRLGSLPDPPTSQSPVYEFLGSGKSESASEGSVTISGVTLQNWETVVVAVYDAWESLIPPGAGDRTQSVSWGSHALTQIGGTYGIPDPFAVLEEARVWQYDAIFGGTGDVVVTFGGTTKPTNKIVSVFGVRNVTVPSAQDNLIEGKVESGGGGVDTAFGPLQPSAGNQVTNQLTFCLLMTLGPESDDAGSWSSSYGGLVDPGDRHGTTNGGTPDNQNVTIDLAYIPSAAVSDQPDFLCDDFSFTQGGRGFLTILLSIKPYP